MNAIVAVCEDWGIGRDGKLLVRSREDMRRFVDLTMGGTVVMGRKTFQSFPGGALKGRRNIVLTRSKDYAPEGAEVVGGAEALREAIADADPETVWLIGGAEVYRLLLDDCERAYVTKFATVEPADSFFPDLDADPAWKLASLEQGGVTEEGAAISYALYEHLS